MRQVDFAPWTDSVLYTMLCESPDIALVLGIKDVAGRPLPADGFPDFSADAIERRREQVRGWRLQLDRFAQLDGAFPDPLTAKILRYVLTRGFQNRFSSEAGFACEGHLDPLTHLSGVHAVAIELFVRRKLPTDPEAVRIEVDRLGKLPAAIRGTCDLLKTRRAQGLVASRPVLDRAIEDIRVAVITELSSNALWRPFANALDASAADARALLRRVHELIEGEIASAYAELMEELEQHRAFGREAISAGCRRGGDAFYAWRFGGHTTTATTPESAHAIGRCELKRLQESLRAEFSQLNYPRALPEAFARLAVDDAFQPGEAGRAQALELIRETMTAAKQFNRPYFRSWPRADVRVEPLAESEERSAHSTYTPAPGKGPGQSGVFWLNCGVAARQPRGEALIMTFHETWPGHHLQLSLAQESSLPALRRALLFNAYLEGWAKYAEGLPESLGFEVGAFGRIARLRTELYSTATLVLDTGVHAFGWSLEEARRFFVEQTGAERSLAEMVTLRSAAGPGLLCAYKVGLLKFRELRDAMREARARDFAVRDFHELMLSSAALPLELLEERVSAEPRP